MGRNNTVLKKYRQVVDFSCYKIITDGLVNQGAAPASCPSVINIHFS
jgi:hypothetical protein